MGKEIDGHKLSWMSNIYEKFAVVNSRSDIDVFFLLQLSLLYVSISHLLNPLLGGGALCSQLLRYETFRKFLGYRLLRGSKF